LFIFVLDNRKIIAIAPFYCRYFIKELLPKRAIQKAPSVFGNLE
jgi:hypothetical protein